MLVAIFAYAERFSSARTASSRLAELWELRPKMCFVAESWELCAEMCVHGDIYIIIIFPHISKPNKMHLVPSIYNFPILRVSSGLISAQLAPN